MTHPMHTGGWQTAVTGVIGVVKGAIEAAGLKGVHVAPN
jgi:hypothetical protein